MPLVAAGIRVHQVKRMPRRKSIVTPYLNAHSIVGIAEGIFDALLSPWQLRERELYKLKQPHPKFEVSLQKKSS
jgi:hypothetical protein